MWTTFDLETTFLLKGCKRRLHAHILEWGMCRYSPGKKTYHALVNPFPTPFTRADMEHTDVEKTVRFWVKVLYRQGLLNTAVKRKSVDDQIRCISDLAVGGAFRTPKEALEGALAFGRGTWLAHNCASFDGPIVRGHVERLGGKVPPMVDTLPIVRRMLDLPSHSRPLVYKHLFKSTYRAHLAVDDSVALAKILRRLSDDVPGLFRDLRTIPGVGRKSEQIFLAGGIRNKRDLRAWVELHPKEEFLATFKVHRAKRLADTLYAEPVVELHEKGHGKDAHVEKKNRDPVRDVAPGGELENANHVDGGPDEARKDGETVHS